MKDKILPIADSSKKYPSFYAVKNLTKKDINEIVRFYDFIISTDRKKIRFAKDEAEWTEN